MSSYRDQIAGVVRDGINRQSTPIAIANKILLLNAQVDPMVAKVYSHPLRARILQALDTDGVQSPTQMSKSLDESLGTVAYHVRYLEAKGFVRIQRTEPRRGATEHFYEKVK